MPKVKFDPKAFKGLTDESQWNSWNEDLQSKLVIMDLACVVRHDLPSVAHEYPAAFEKIDDRWEVGVSATSTEGASQQISFVNSIATSKGGSHVTYVADKIATSLMKVVEKKNKGGIKITKNQIKSHLCIFVNWRK